MGAILLCSTSSSPFRTSSGGAHHRKDWVPRGVGYSWSAVCGYKGSDLPLLIGNIGGPAGDSRLGTEFGGTLD